jgi:hypothetical protein
VFLFRPLIDLRSAHLNLWTSARFPGAAFAFLLNWKKGRSPVDVPNAPWTLRLFGVRTRLEQIRSLSRQSFALGDSLGQPNQVETVVNLSPAINHPWSTFAESPPRIHFGQNANCFNFFAHGFT